MGTTVGRNPSGRRLLGVAALAGASLALTAAPAGAVIDGQRVDPAQYP